MHVKSFCRNSLNLKPEVKVIRTIHHCIYAESRNSFDLQKSVLHLDDLFSLRHCNFSHIFSDKKLNIVIIPFPGTTVCSPLYPFRKFPFIFYFKGTWLSLTYYVSVFPSFISVQYFLRRALREVFSKEYTYERTFL